MAGDKINDKSEYMKASLPDVIAAMKLNDLAATIEKGGKLHDGTIVASVQGTRASKGVRELGFEVKQEASEKKG